MTRNGDNGDDEGYLGPRPGKGASTHDAPQASSSAPGSPGKTTLVDGLAARGLVAPPPTQAGSAAKADAMASIVATHDTGTRLPPVTAAPAAHVHLAPAAGSAGSTSSPKADPLELYLSVQSNHIWDAVKVHLAQVPWPEPHPLVVWDDPQWFGLGVWAQLKNDAPLDEPAAIRNHLFPANYRDAIIAMLPVYTRTWLPGVGQAIAELFEDAARASLRRIGPRYAAVAQHDSRTVGAVTYDQLVKSHPMDQPVAAALVRTGVAHYLPSANQADRLTAPQPLRPVELEWLGAVDHALWNWVKAVDPADASVEEVSSALYSTYGDNHPGESGSTLAYALTPAPPLFGLPPSWATRFSQANKFAPTGAADEADRNARLVALATSKVSDDVARAQHRATTAKAPTPRADALATTLGDSLIAASYLHRTLSPWNQGPAIQSAVRWVIKKQAHVVTMEPDELGTWGPIIDNQKARLLRIVAGVKQLTDRTTGLGIKDATSPNAKPIVLALTTYARAAALSHLDDTSEQLIAEAVQQTQQLAIAMLRGVTNDMNNAVSVASGARQVGVSEQVNQADQVSTDSRMLQGELAAGHVVDAGSIEETTLHAQEIAFRTRLEGLFWSVHALRMAVDKAGSGLASHIAAKFQGSFKTLKQALNPVEATINDIARNMQGQDAMVAGSTWATPEDQRDARRVYLKDNQRGLKQLTDSIDLVTFLREGADTVQWQEFATACVKMAALIGVSIMAGAVGGMAIQAAETVLVRVGSAEAIAEIAESGAMLARAGSVTGRAGSRLLGAATEAGINTAGQVKIQGGDAGEAFMTNLLATIGSNAIFSTLTKDLEIARTIEMQTSSLWAKAGKLVLEEAVTLSAHTVINVAVGYLAHMVVTHQTVTPMMAREWLMQGIATGLGRYVGAALKAQKPNHDKLGTLPESLGTQRLLTTSHELAALAHAAETTPSAGAATELMIKHHQLLAEELRVLETLEHDPEILTAPPETTLSLKDVHSAIALIRTEQAKIGPVTRKLAVEAAGLEEIVPNSEYRGSPDQLRRVLETAHAVGLEVGTPTKTGNTTRVRIGDAEIVFHEGAATPSAPPKRTAEEQFLEDVRSKLDAGERAKFDQIVGKRPAKEIHEQFNGDTETARKTVVSAVERERGQVVAHAKQLERMEELRQWAYDLGLAKNPQVHNIIATYEAAMRSATTDRLRTDARTAAVKDLRSLLMGARVEQQLYLEFQHQPGRHVVRHDIQVWQAQDPKYKTPAEFKAAQAELFARSQRGVREIDGRIYLEITDFDFLVTTKGPNQDTVVHIEELKTGVKDTHDKANQQLINGRDAVAEATSGGRPVKLLEASGKDVTGDFDLSSFNSAQQRTRGPQKTNKPFNKDLGIDAKSLETLIGRLLDEWRLPPPTSPTTPTPEGPP